MKFISTRNKQISVTGAAAIVKGLSAEGGLFVPESFPNIGKKEFEEFAALDYPKRASYLIGMFLPELKKDLDAYCEKAYARFDGDPAPLVKIDENLYMLELWHGPTHAFKDIALTLLPYLMTGSKAALGETSETLILTATSGDTGKAALEGFKDVAGTKVAVFYPDSGVSEMQKLQMQTTAGGNVKVFAIKGNFDDAQTAVKEIFTDKKMEEELKALNVALSSANSINFGRLVPQIVYYFSAYADMVNGGTVRYGDKVNFCVPTGNFGNILAGYYAYRMGLPVRKLISASNVNNVISDFINGGEYSVNRKFFKTTSPSMDILVSSNLERLLFELSGRDDALTAERMHGLKKNGVYEITDSELDGMNRLFWAGFAPEESVKAALSDVYEEYGYITDPHTAVALSVYTEYMAETGDETDTVVVSTASPYKFVNDVLKAIGAKPSDSGVRNLKKLEDLTALPVPDTLINLYNLEKLHTGVIDMKEAAQALLHYIKK